MAKLRVFVSSTCYDLGVLRSELRPFLIQLGYEPIMSDYSDVLYDPRTHTHVSCVKEIPSADVVVLIIGARFGGTAVPSALKDFNFKDLQELSTKTEILNEKERLSITQLEILTAIAESIPVYAFVEERVFHDHQVYEKNKENKDVIGAIEFPSIQKKESARYIFEFLNYLSNRITNNSLTSFSRLEDIREHLTSQWSQLFQRLLQESRTKLVDERRYKDFSESIEDLKAVVLASVATPDLRYIAKGAIQYRRLISFVSSFDCNDIRELLLSNRTWDELLEAIGIVEAQFGEFDERMVRPEVFLIATDGTFYRLRMTPRAYEDLRRDWDGFVKLEEHARGAIVDALLEDREARRFGMFQLQHMRMSLDEYKLRRESRTAIEMSDEILPITTTSRKIGTVPIKSEGDDPLSGETIA